MKSRRGVVQKGCRVLDRLSMLRESPILPSHRGSSRSGWVGLALLSQTAVGPLELTPQSLKETSLLVSTAGKITTNSRGCWYERRILVAATGTYLEKIVEDRWNK